MAVHDRNTVSIVERVGSVFSLLGCLFIITTFCCSKAFHKPINRLVFYASFGNGVVNIATLMAASFIDSPASPGCQVQAFLIQWLMPADALWTLSMAVNVYLKFYHKYDTAALRRVELIYIACCYGIPFVPAFTYLFIKNQEGKRVYGNAGIWCWISQEWEIWRIVTLYGPVWIIILLTLFIYIRTGSDIYRNHKELRHFSRTSRTDMDTTNSSTWVNTEVIVTSESLAREHSKKCARPSPREHRGSGSSSGTTHTMNTAYSVTITANNRSPTPTPNTPSMSRAEWSYAKCALLFFTAMFITWIPSSANRVYSVIHPDRSSMALQYMGAAVLPLQGFWNAVIYTVTSWGACLMVFDYIRHLGRAGATELTTLRKVDLFKMPGRHRPAPEMQRSESMTRLAQARIRRDGLNGESMRIV